MSHYLDFAPYGARAFIAGMATGATEGTTALGDRRWERLRFVVGFV